jgi:hypothetical protein
MKLILKLILFIFISSTAFAQSLPEMKVETADKKSVNIPGDLKGKYSLICFACSQKAEPDLVSWLDPVYQKFIAKTGLMDDMYDVNVYFIPVLTGTNVSFAGSMKKKFRETAQEDLQSHVLFCTENGKDVIRAANMDDSSVPYFFLLDKEAKIIYKTQGKFTDDKFDKIDELIQ